jgi:hypothetical protein
MCFNIKTINQVSERVLESTWEGICWYVGAKIFTVKPAATSGLFGFSSNLIYCSSQPFFTKVFEQEKATTASKFLGKGMHNICTITVSNLITKLATGLSLSLTGALQVYLLAFAVSYVTQSILTVFNLQIF